MKSKNLVKGAIVGAVWGIISIIGAVGGMTYVSGTQRSVTGSWTGDAIVFLLAFLGWQLTKIFPENILTGLIVLCSPILSGTLLGSGIGYLYQKLIESKGEGEK